jgi:hypothetical protein
MLVVVVVMVVIPLAIAAPGLFMVISVVCFRAMARFRGLGRGGVGTPTDQDITLFNSG